MAQHDDAGYQEYLKRDAEQAAGERDDAGYLEYLRRAADEQAANLHDSPEFLNAVRGTTYE